MKTRAEKIEKAAVRLADAVGGTQVSVPSSDQLDELDSAALYVRECIALPPAAPGDARVASERGNFMQLARDFAHHGTEAHRLQMVESYRALRAAEAEAAGGGGRE